MMRALSALADTALLAPSSALLLAYLLARGGARLAGALALALAVGLGGTLAAKFAFHACGASFTDLNVTSPSGHVSFAILFYGALAVLLADGRSRMPRALIGVAAVVLLGAIAASRVRVGAHTPLEVAVGGMIGSAGLWVFWALRGPQASPPLWLPVAVGGALAAFVVLTGQHLTFEHDIARTARQLTAGLDMCAPPTERRAALPDIPLRR